MKTLVSKLEFARLKQRSPSAVTKWLKAGKITAAALVGEGNSAKIWLERAEADLAASLDPSQQVSQAKPILPTHVTARPLDLTAPMPAQPAAVEPREASERELDMRRRSKADADKAEFDAEAARRKLAIDEGRWINAEEAAKTWGRELARLMTDTETFLFATLARELAEEHGLDWKLLATKMRERFRIFRAERSTDAGERRAALEASKRDGDANRMTASTVAVAADETAVA